VAVKGSPEQGAFKEEDQADSARGKAVCRILHSCGQSGETNMSIEALNLLLGLSTIDSRVRKAYSCGEWDQLLQEFDFNSDMRRTLSLLEADSFEDYLRAAYLVVAQAESVTGVSLQHPNLGLRFEGDPEGAKRVA
jgi:hypothetical protein